MLASRRLQPAKLLAAGYRFRSRRLEEALLHEVQVAEKAEVERHAKAGPSAMWQPNRQQPGHGEDSGVLFVTCLSLAGSLEWGSMGGERHSRGRGVGCPLNG
jgi:hypothetical protein